MNISRGDWRRYWTKTYNGLNTTKINNRLIYIKILTNNQIFKYFCGSTIVSLYHKDNTTYIVYHRILFIGFILGVDSGLFGSN